MFQHPCCWHSLAYTKSFLGLSSVSRATQTQVLLPGTAPELQVWVSGKVCPDLGFDSTSQPLCTVSVPWLLILFPRGCCCPLSCVCSSSPHLSSGLVLLPLAGDPQAAHSQLEALVLSPRLDGCSVKAPTEHLPQIMV